MPNLEDLTLYHFESCPYCLFVRDTLEEMELQIKLKDVRENPKFKSELIRGGGKQTVPCLHIKGKGVSEKWMYESQDIVSFLKETFAK